VRAIVADELRELDPGPADAESLTLNGYVASWLHAGQARSAVLR
jgi:hypothetical protein